MDYRSKKVEQFFAEHCGCAQHPREDDARFIPTQGAQPTAELRSYPAGLGTQNASFRMKNRAYRKRYNP
jgi:hypothetical protein